MFTEEKAHALVSSNQAGPIARTPSVDNRLVLHPPATQVQLRREGAEPFPVQGTTALAVHHVIASSLSQGRLPPAERTP